ncbi:MAG: DUF167 domain-containing protein [Actinobacteria bacterium]|nr:DUF167 domain-containing protein [Actinomycetota bacterium]
MARATALAEGGRANAAIEALIARKLGVPRRAVRIISGARSRSKRVVIEVGNGRPSRPRLPPCLRSSASRSLGDSSGGAPHM